MLKRSMGGGPMYRAMVAVPLTVSPVMKLSICIIYIILYLHFNQFKSCRCAHFKKCEFLNLCRFIIFGIIEWYQVCRQTPESEVGLLNSNKSLFFCAH